MIILWKYILRGHLLPFIFATSVLMFVFLLQFIMKYINDLAGKGLSAGIIVEFIVLNLAWMLVLAVPMAVLVATIMAFGKYSSLRETVAMRSSGISIYSMILPPFIGAILLCLGLIYFNNNVLPDANHRAKILTTDIYRKKPTLTIIPGLFNTALYQRAIHVRATFETSNDLEGVTLYDFSQPGSLSTVTAVKGRISFTPDYRMLVMDMYDGEIHRSSLGSEQQYRRIRFERYKTYMPTEGFEFQRSSEDQFARGDREMSAQDMRRRVDSLSQLLIEPRAQVQRIFDREIAAILDTAFITNEFPQSGHYEASVTKTRMTSAGLNSSYNLLNYFGRQIREYEVEIHKKYSIPVACIVFVLIGAPLGMMSRKGTFGVAASLSLGFFVVYWMCLIQGEKLADRGYIEPWLGMWFANILVGTLGIYLTVRTSKEQMLINWDALRRFVPKRMRLSESVSDE